jgi:1-acyl-sn-glycerol-3-phosphate acyltransferase
MSLLRSLAFNIWLYAITFVFSVWHGLFTRERAAVVAVARHWARLVLGGARCICGVDWVVTGERLPAAGAALIAPMHQSAFDTVVWLLLVPDCVFILKRELTRVPLFGRLLLRGGMIPVDRGGGAAALRTLIRRTTADLAEGRQIVIFPEGTRVAPGVRVKLQPGVAALAMRAGLPVIPVVTDSGHYWGKRSFRKHPGTIRIVVLPPLPAGLPRDALLARLTEAYAEGYAALRREQTVDKPGDTAPPELRHQPNGIS